MIKIHAIQTGIVQIKQAQIDGAASQLSAMSKMFLGNDWSDWLPIYAWLIEHSHGPIVVDTGETAKTGEKGYLPRFHPYYSRAVRFNVKPEDEVGPQLAKLGVDPASVKTVIMTHLHTDHAGGLYHFPNAKIYVDPIELKATSGFGGKVNGYLTHRWPEWFEPQLIQFNDGPLGPFPQSFQVTADGAVSVVPTYGHSPGHVSVIVQTPEMKTFIAGDASYNQANMLKENVDGLSSSDAAETLRRIHRFTTSQPTIYLPSHDPESAERLDKQQIV